MLVSPSKVHCLEYERNAFDINKHKGDLPVLLAARKEIRSNFEASRDLTPEEKETKIQHANEVAKVLRMNVVQGKLDEKKSDTYDLRIHKDIELGDNESINQKKQQQAASGSSGKCCSA